MQNIADLVDPNDSKGRTYREINNSTPHQFNVGELVELESGARLFVVKQTRDCDGTPLYCLASVETEVIQKWRCGIHGESLRAVKPGDTPSI